MVPGLSNVGSYQASGKPFVSSSATVPASASGTPHWKINLPSVSKQITVYNNSATGQDIRMAFSENGLNNNNANYGNYFLVQPGEDGGIAQTFDAKATELYIMGDSGGAFEVSVFASLTGIDVERINNISSDGTNWSGSAGIG